MDHRQISQQVASQHRQEVACESDKFDRINKTIDFLMISREIVVNSLNALFIKNRFGDVPLLSRL